MCFFSHKYAHNLCSVHTFRVHAHTDIKLWNWVSLAFSRFTRIALRGYFMEMSVRGIHLLLIILCFVVFICIFW